MRLMARTTTLPSLCLVLAAVACASPFCVGGCRERLQEPGGPVAESKVTTEPAAPAANSAAPPGTMEPGPGGAAQPEPTEPEPGGETPPEPTEPRPDGPPQPEPMARREFKRLLHYQPVAHTSKRAPGEVAPAICSPVQGWRAHVENHLKPLVGRLGPGTFDWWGQRIGGSWVQGRIPLNETTSTVTQFEQLDEARRRFPQLVDFTPLAEFARANGIELYGYIGFPRCDADARFRFAANPAHCDPAQMNRWYGELVRFGFTGVGHDWRQNPPPDSGALRVNFPYLRKHGIEPFIEAIPRREDRHLLGLSVVVSESRLLFTERDPETYFTVDEIRQAGGRVIIMVAHAPPKFTGDVWAWRYERALARLAEGETVAVSLVGLARAGHRIERLVELSKRPPISLPPPGEQ